MGSEKVKEIKSLLEIFANDNEPDGTTRICREALTLINELESENEVLCVELSRYTEHCVEMKNGTLKQFAERLKKKGKSTYDFFQCPTKENKVISFDDIDETLKEFIKND